MDEEKNTNIEPMNVVQFIDAVFVTRKGSVKRDGNEVIVTLEEDGQEVEVLHIYDMGTYIIAAMLPDVYTYSDALCEDTCEKIKFTIGEKMSVRVTTTMTVEDMLGVTCKAIKDINLYGYVVSKEE